MKYTVKVNVDFQKYTSTFKNEFNLKQNCSKFYDELESQKEKKKTFSVGKQRARLE